MQLENIFKEHREEINKLNLLGSITFLSDITQHFNSAYVKLQGEDRDVFNIV